MGSTFWPKPPSGGGGGGGGHTIQKDGSSFPQRTNLNFKNPTIVVSDDPVNDRTDVELNTDLSLYDNATSGFFNSASQIDHNQLLNYDINEHRIINDSGSSTTELFSASKILSLVNAVSAGIDVKDPVATSTEGLGNIVLSGEQTLNGVTTSGSRVLVVEQTNAAENGIYVTSAGAWTRASDADTDAEVTNGMSTMVLDSNSTRYRTQYVLTTADPIVVGTTPLSFASIPPLSFGTTAGTAAEGNDPRIPTQDENDALQGTDGVPSLTNRYVTDSDPRLGAATTTTSGIIELATQAEVDAGTDTVRAVTPSTLANSSLLDINIGDAIVGGTIGSVLFIDAGGNLAEDNANLFFDNTNNRLGIGTSTPNNRLHVVGNIEIESSTASTIVLNNSGSGKILSFVSSVGGFNSIDIVLGNTGSVSKLNTSAPAWTMNKSLRFDISGGVQVYTGNAATGLNLFLGTAALPTIYISGSGNPSGSNLVGIGTYSPDYKMHIVSGAGESPFNVDTNSKTNILYVDSSGKPFVNGGDPLRGVEAESGLSITTGVLTWDMSESANGLNASIVLTENVTTFNINNAVSGMVGVIRVIQDAVGGRTLALPTGSKVVNNGGGTYTPTSAANAVDVLTFYYDGTTFYWNVGLNYT